MSETMRISPRYSVEDWKVLTFSTEEDWQKSIDILEDRLRGRFMSIIAAIESCEYAGFAVMALDCLLIETLQQFKEGKEQTPRKKSGKYFIQFLTETSFRNFFTRKMAAKFYDYIRCGILHQAEVKGSSRLRISYNVPLVKIAEDGDGLIINRKLFHQYLVKVFEEYLSFLRDAENSELRSKFKKKMDYICRVEDGLI